MGCGVWGVGCGVWGVGWWVWVWVWVWVWLWVGVWVCGCVGEGVGVGVGLGWMWGSFIGSPRCCWAHSRLTTVSRIAPFSSFAPGTLLAVNAIIPKKRRGKGKRPREDEYVSEALCASCSRVPQFSCAVVMYVRACSWCPLAAPVPGTTRRTPLSTTVTWWPTWSRWTKWPCRRSTRDSTCTTTPPLPLHREGTWCRSGCMPAPGPSNPFSPLATSLPPPHTMTLALLPHSF